MIEAGAAQEPVVETAAGKVRGTVVNGLNRFKGIPYADVTSGDGRFLPPRPPRPWRGIRNAFEVGRSSPQPGRSRNVDWWAWITDDQPQGEDCLVLNVYAPEPSATRKRPVMVYLHGGGFNTGSASTAGTDGTHLARRGDVVVVTINHRLNVFGFLYLASFGERYAESGNAGMLDAVAALRWVKQNIAAFGGDPDNVTIFGQSGGASKVAVLLAMPQAQGLFHKAIIQSASSLIRMATPEQATAAARGLLDELGGERSLDRLGEASAADLLAARQRSIAKAGGMDNFRPVVDGRSLPSHPFDPAAPGLAQNIPLLIGVTDTEQTFFLGPDAENFQLGRPQSIARIARFIGISESDAGKLYDSYAVSRKGASPSDILIYVLSDQMYRRNDTLAADRKAGQGGAAVYSYLITWRSPVLDGRLKSPHTLCIPFVFGTYDAAALMIGTGSNRVALSQKMMGAWASFAEAGVPRAQGLPQWEAYNANTRPTMILDDECRMESDPRKADRIALDNYPLYAPEAAARRAAPASR
ncbi:carboxylesterase/lipase family protein [Bradyrhizobium sp. LHD-71]|uniref:carboxylesterase/lipase family protein n=1 Tax=Bradyrhizobium sp. LHD-71 TaxID=3072141 RepID=UPI0028103136|nr:carboxylesterase/lipase family protein [Bradyrhizobium sp. LHD-71]MDQ8729751.1 carboxylesterase/lipase family protein [Bradyrhizobium sp. LHD-71]